MIVITSAEEMRQHVRQWRKEGRSVGLAPTMGSLHKGHLGVIDRSVKENDRTVVSVFVNPARFPTVSEYISFPRSKEKDAAFAGEHGVDVLFIPDSAELEIRKGSEGTLRTHIELGTLGHTMYKPLHPEKFSAVCTAMAKLFNIVTPDNVYYNRRDAQHLELIRRMAKDMHYGIRVVGVPPVREADGLAVTFRNDYLTPEQRKAATCLSRAVILGETMIRPSTQVPDLMDAMRAVIDAEPLAHLEYISVVDAETLHPVSVVNTDVIVVVAAYFGDTRLLDNFTYRIAYGSEGAPLHGAVPKDDFPLPNATEPEQRHVTYPISKGLPSDRDDHGILDIPFVKGSILGEKPIFEE